MTEGNNAIRTIRILYDQYERTEPPNAVLNQKQMSHKQLPSSYYFGSARMVNERRSAPFQDRTYPSSLKHPDSPELDNQSWHWPDGKSGTTLSSSHHKQQQQRTTDSPATVHSLVRGRPMFVEVDFVPSM